MSTVPTGENSPYMDWVDNAFPVFPSGDVFNGVNDYVNDSYGKDEAALMHQILINYWWLRSPGTDLSGYAWGVTSSGDVNYISNGGVYYSYGRLTR